MCTDVLRLVSPSPCAPGRPHGSGQSSPRPLRAEAGRPAAGWQGGTGPVASGKSSGWECGSHVRTLTQRDRGRQSESRQGSRSVSAVQEGTLPPFQGEPWALLGSRAARCGKGTCEPLGSRPHLATRGLPGPTAFPLCLHRVHEPPGLPTPDAETVRGALLPGRLRRPRAGCGQKGGLLRREKPLEHQAAGC